MLPGSSTYTLATLGYVLGRSGKGTEARTILRELEKRQSGQYVSPVSFLTVHLGLGDLDGALDWMERACEERRGWLAYIDVNPIADPVRNLPRFVALRRKLAQLGIR
jgi:hypothetical protein